MSRVDEIFAIYNDKGSTADGGERVINSSMRCRRRCWRSNRVPLRH